MGQVIVAVSHYCTGDITGYCHLLQTIMKHSVVVFDVRELMMMTDWSIDLHLVLLSVVLLGGTNFNLHLACTSCLYAEHLILSIE